MKKILSIILCSLFLFTGCQKQENIPEEINKNEIEFDVIVLEHEYNNIMSLIEDVLFYITNEDMDVNSVLKLIERVQENRIEPTQPLTIELNNQLDKLIELGIEYCTTINEEEKMNVEKDMVDVLNVMEEIMIEIEALLIEYEEV